MEPLKEMFGQPYYTKLAAAVKQAYKPFKAEKFLADVMAPIQTLALNARMRHTSAMLHQYLPEEYSKVIDIMRSVIQLMPTGYTALVFPDYVSQYGKHDMDTSLRALHYFTRFGSSEFAIRTFLKLDFDQTIQQMYTWSEDENEHVRRLASEGSRPRLPWSFKLDAVIQNPKHTQPILENLKQDESLYVRKSVANHLNDISKDSPAYVLQLIKQWDQSNPHTSWIIKRGCRSLLKQGNQKSLAAFKFTKVVRVAIQKFTYVPNSIVIGEALVFSFVLVSKSTATQKLMVDYRIHYAKKSGALLPKVFKLKELSLKPGESLKLSKKQRFQDFTTRKHVAGKHKLEILVNGIVVKQVDFMVKE